MFLHPMSYMPIARLVLIFDMVQEEGVPGNYQSDSEVRNYNNANGFPRLDINGYFKIIKGLSGEFRIINVLNTKIYTPPFAKQDKYDTENQGRFTNVFLKYVFK